nr:MAG TPA: hypothetical protein [Caudoviricetes sp.]
MAERRTLTCAYAPASPQRAVSVSPSVTPTMRQTSVSTIMMLAFLRTKNIADFGCRV